MKSVKPAQVVVITGASGGIGRATATAFAARGAKVALLARGESGLAGAVADVESAGGEALSGFRGGTPTPGDVKPPIKRRLGITPRPWLSTVTVQVDRSEKRQSMAEGVPEESPSCADPATVFTALADIVYQGSAPTEVYAAICVAATLMVPGCDRASMLIRRNDGTYTTVASSDGIARKIDQLELEVGDGPCLDAIEETSAQIDADLTTHSQWPTLASRVVAETPVRGAMGIRLSVDHRKVGALNLFSDTPNVFDETSAARAIVLAAFATVATNAAALGEDATTLRRGLASNREIGKAIGMMMVLNDISDAEAFDMLRRTSQDMNIKLADVAAEFIKRRSHPAPDDTGQK